MKFDDIPNTFEISAWECLKITLRKYWMSLVASVLCFIASGVHVVNFIGYMWKSNSAGMVLSLLYIIAVMPLAVINLRIVLKRYKENKLNNSRH